MADWFGRKVPIMIGCVLMTVGGLLGAFANGYGSMCDFRNLPASDVDLDQCTSQVVQFSASATRWLRCHLRFS